MWICSRNWDGFWILSGVPFGLALVLLANIANIRPEIITIYIIIVVQSAHTISPIVLAWGHAGFRRMMVENKRKYIGLPLAIIGLCTLAGWISIELLPDIQFTGLDGTRLALVTFFEKRPWGSPAAWVMVFYMVWNLFHFSKQNFGVLALYQRKSGQIYDVVQRKIDYVFCFGVQTALTLGLFLAIMPPYPAFYTHLLVYLFPLSAGMFILAREGAVTGKYFSPRVIFIFSHTLSLVFAGGLWVTAINGLNHFLTAIGLSAHVYGRYKRSSPLWFVGVATLAAVASFALLFWNGTWSWNPRDMMHMTVMVMTFRLGVGMVHFCYDRWLWQLSKPEVRATIGASLFAQPTADAIPAAGLLSQRG